MSNGTRYELTSTQHSAGSAGAAGAFAMSPPTALSPEEREHLVQLLKESQAGFLELLTGLSDAQFAAPAAGSGWSVQQIAEHVVLGEALLLAKVEEALAGPPHPDWQAQDARKTRFLERALPDRSHKAIAPEPIQPHHHWTRTETMARYRQARDRTLALVEKLDQPVKDRTAEHPFPIFNTLNAYHWLLYIPLHNQRHNQQIAEIVKGARA